MRVTVYSNRATTQIEPQGSNSRVRRTPLTGTVYWKPIFTTVVPSPLMLQASARTLSSKALSLTSSRKNLPFSGFLIMVSIYISLATR